MSNREYNVAVYIGRFQIYHKEHQKVLENALKLADKVLVLIGSYQVASNIKNPFSYEERVDMIKSTFPKPVTKNGITTHDEECLKYRNIEFIPVRDYYYNENLWVTEVQQKVSHYITPNYNVALVGAYKDSSSYYLNLFPQWEFVPMEQKKFLSSTSIREKIYYRDEKVMEYNPYQKQSLFEGIKDHTYIHSLSSDVYQWLCNHYFETEKYHRHIQEYNYIKDYQKQWESSPFPPTFVTVDSVVICSGHILIVERGINPGKGMLALPGGFLKQTEKLEDAALRELKEETGIGLNKIILKSLIKDTKVFDYPTRSLRGRTITHAFYLKLPDGDLPLVSAGDDANKTMWMSIADFYEKRGRFHEDHQHIINYFLNRG